MMMANIKITFFPRTSYLNSKEPYLSKYIRDLSFKFNEKLYFIGFIVESENKVDMYEIGKTYKLTFQFPSISMQLMEDNFTHWDHNNIIDICMGSKAIGEARLLDCWFKES